MESALNVLECKVLKLKGIYFEGNKIKIKRKLYEKLLTENFGVEDLHPLVGSESVLRNIVEGV